MATRKIKDAKDLSTNELIYFKGHAQATYMSDGRTVEDAINNIDISGGGEIPSLAAVATSGDYNDLKNKPTIPNAVTESTVSGWGFTKNTGTITGVSANGTSVATNGVANIPAATTSKYGVTKLSSATNSTSTTLAATASAVKSAYDLANGKYTKPSTGIPFSDFEEQVQASIIKAEESVQGVSMSVTTGNATAGNFFNVNKDAQGNVSIQMIQNTLASGKIAIPYTTDVKQYIDQVVANAGGGGTGGGEDIRYFTDFTVEHFIEECMAENLISDDTTELFNAMRNNKIICVPYNYYDKGFIVASYRCDQDSDYPYMHLEKNGVEYSAYTGDDGNLYGSRPYSQNVTVVEIEGDEEVIFECLDNHIYKIIGYVNMLIPATNDLQKGTTIHFTTADSPTIMLYWGVLWANGVMPSLEPYVTYELSLIVNTFGQINAVLTPFKEVLS